MADLYAASGNGLPPAHPARPHSPRTVLEPRQACSVVLLTHP